MEWVETISMSKRKIVFFSGFNGLFGPLIFTIVKLKRRPAITSSASYGFDSCHLILVITFLRFATCLVIDNFTVIPNLQGSWLI